MCAPWSQTKLKISYIFIKANIIKTHPHNIFSAVLHYEQLLRDPNSANYQIFF